jgi:hypothetical protein
MFLLLLLNYQLSLSLANEPMCSKFAYEEQLLEKMIRQEIKLEMIQNDIKKTQEAVSNTLDEMKRTSEEIARDKERNEGNVFFSNVLFCFTSDILWLLSSTLTIEFF